MKKVRVLAVGATALLLLILNLQAAAPAAMQVSTITLSHQEICFIEKAIAENETLIALLVYDLKMPLWGMAFTIEKDPQTELIRYEPGNFFERVGEPLYLVKEKNATVIAGATLKRGEVAQRGSGTLIKFYFRNEAGPRHKVTFNNVILAQATPSITKVLLKSPIIACK